MNERTIQYGLVELISTPTAHQSNESELKSISPEVRVWLTLNSDENGYGKEYNNQVDIEVYVNGAWSILDTYEAV